MAERKEMDRDPVAKRRQAFQEAPMEKKRASEEYLKTIPDLRKGIYLRATTGESSPQEVIKANCQFCVGYEDLVSRIRECNVYICPCWIYRPHQ